MKRAPLNKERFLSLGHVMNPNELLFKSMVYKQGLQMAIIPHLTPDDKDDIRNCRLNTEVVDKLCRLAGGNMPSFEIEELYACAFAIATIIKEYDWGTSFLKDEGLYLLAARINEIDNF